MRKLVPLLAILILTTIADAARPIYKVVELPEVTITRINTTTKMILVTLPNGGTGTLSVGPKTWFIKDNDEATFEELKVGQRVRVHHIPRTTQAVAIEVLH